MDFSELEKKLGYTFRDKSLLARALTHSTFTYESPGSSEGHNERLEFLGDSVLDLTVGDILYRDAAGYDEGAMTKIRALIVCETTLAAVARQLELGRFMRFGKGETHTGGMEKSSNLSSALEAVFAAIYLDGGYPEVYDAVRRLLGGPAAKAAKGELVYDYKSRLLEYIQGADRKAVFEFRIIREEGPDHRRIFFCEFSCNGRVVGRGSGPSKKEAEQEAARDALPVISRYCPEPGNDRDMV